MKKFLSTITMLGSILVAQIGSSQAATVSVPGTIDPIIIGSVFSLTLVTVKTTPDNPNTPANEFAQVFAPSGGVVAGNLYFGSVDMTPAGIYANTPANNTYGDIAHRAGGLYTETRLYMDNNEHNNFNVTLTVSGNLIALAPPTNNFPEGTRVMHVNSSSLVADDQAGATTQFPSNIKNFGANKAVPNSTPITLYGTTALSSPVSDAFKSLVFLDYLPIVIPAATYAGTTTWSITSI